MTAHRSRLGAFLRSPLGVRGLPASTACSPPGFTALAIDKEEMRLAVYISDEVYRALPSFGSLPFYAEITLRFSYTYWLNETDPPETVTLDSDPTTVVASFSKAMFAEYGATPPSISRAPLEGGGFAPVSIADSWRAELDFDITAAVAAFKMKLAGEAWGAIPFGYIDSSGTPEYVGADGPASVGDEVLSMRLVRVDAWRTTYLHNGDEVRCYSRLGDWELLPTFSIAAYYYAQMDVYYNAWALVQGDSASMTGPNSSNAYYLPDTLNQWRNRWAGSPSTYSLETATKYAVIWPAVNSADHIGDVSGATTVNWPEPTGLPTTNLHRVNNTNFSANRWYFQYVPYFSFESGLAGEPTITPSISAIVATDFTFPLLAGVWNRREGSWFADLASMGSVMLSESDLSSMADEAAAVWLATTSSLIPGAAYQGVNAAL